MKKRIFAICCIVVVLVTFTISSFALGINEQGARDTLLTPYRDIAFQYIDPLEGIKDVTIPFPNKQINVGEQINIELPINVESTTTTTAIIWNGYYNAFFRNLDLLTEYKNPFEYILSNQLGESRTITKDKFKSSIYIWDYDLSTSIRTKREVTALTFSYNMNDTKLYMQSLSITTSNGTENYSLNSSGNMVANESFEITGLNEIGKDAQYIADNFFTFEYNNLTNTEAIISANEAYEQNGTELSEEQINQLYMYMFFYMSRYKSSYQITQSKTSEETIETTTYNKGKTITYERISDTSIQIKIPALNTINGTSQSAFPQPEGKISFKINWNDRVYHNASEYQIIRGNRITPTLWTDDNSQLTGQSYTTVGKLDVSIRKHLFDASLTPEQAETLGLEAGRYIIADGCLNYSFYIDENSMFPTQIYTHLSQYSFYDEVLSEINGYDTYRDFQINFSSETDQPKRTRDCVTYIQANAGLLSDSEYLKIMFNIPSILYETDQNFEDTTYIEGFPEEYIITRSGWNLKPPEPFNLAGFFSGTLSFFTTPILGFLSIGDMIIIAIGIGVLFAGLKYFAGG